MIEVIDTAGRHVLINPAHIVRVTEIVPRYGSPERAAISTADFYVETTTSYADIKRMLAAHHPGGDKCPC